MNDISNHKVYFSVLTELLNRHLRTKGLVMKGTSFAVDLDPKDLETATKTVTIGRQSNEHTPLNSIFENLGKDKKSYTKPLSLSPLSIDGNAGFPNGIDDKNWFDGFQADINTIPFKDVENLRADTETFLFVLQKWTSNLGSSYGEDIPFFDFAKLTAAVYICLQKADNKDKPFLFVSGGVSGIQEYLFDIVSKNAAKNLKGRSFYLHVLVEVILHRIIKNLGVYLANVVYASGGNYLLLVPNTKDNLAELETLKNTISDSLFATHHIGLYTELAWFETDVDTLQKDYPSVGKALADKIAEDKRHKFNRQIAKQFNKIFEPIEMGGETKKDVITNEEILEHKDVFILEDAVPRLATFEEFEKGENLVNLKNAYQIKLGFGLKSAKTYYPNEEKKIESRKGYHFPVILGVDDNNVENEPDFDDKTFSYSNYEMQVNDTHFFKMSYQNSKTYGFQFYGGNDYPEIALIKGKGIKQFPKTFSELAGQNDEEKGAREYADEFKEPTFKRLAVLRMDVDGLGTVFRERLPSLVVHSTLSRNVDWFFKGYLNTIWLKNKSYKEFTQIIYSGGDDLFIVGRWRELISFAKEIREELKKWTAPNEGISISGGISLVTPKFPVIKAAKYAGDAEDEAKKHKLYGLKKNAFSMIGVTMNWDYEFVVVDYLKNQILQLTNDKIHQKPLPRSFIFKVNSFFETVDSNKKDGIDDFRWIWQMAYDLTRMKERFKPTRESKTDVVDFLQGFIDWTILRKIPEPISKLIDNKTIEHFTFFKLLNLACIWASFELRDQEKSR